MDAKCCCSNILGINNITSLTNDYLESTIPIIIEKDCGFELITYQNEYATTIDLYKYIEQYYSHLNYNKILFFNKERDKIIFRNDNLKIKDTFSDNKLLSITNLPERTIYKIYLSLI